MINQRTMGGRPRGRASTEALRASAWHRQAEGERRTMIFSGMTMTVVGCLLKVELDEATRTGRVICQPRPGRGPLSTIEVDAVMIDARQLAERVKRTMGISWRIAMLDKENLPATADQQGAMG
jgi:hypothetical protein